MSTAARPRTGLPATTRVAAVIDTHAVSGPGRQLAALADALRDHGVDLRVFLFHRRGRAPSPYAAYLADAGIRTTVVEERGRGDLSVLRRLDRALADFEPHVVQTHSYKATAAVRALRLAGRRWAWAGFFHGATTEDAKVRLYHWLDRRLLGRADALVVMSTGHRDEFAHAGTRVRVIYNAVLSPRRSDAGAIPSRRGADPVLAIVGRLSSEKGVDVFLEAAALLAGRGERFTALIAGDGPDRSQLEARRDALGLRERVEFLGHLSSPEAVYARADLLVVPSRSEGLPNVLLEALRADLPAVATRVGAIPEVLSDPLSGVLVQPGSVQALADGIAQALRLRIEPEARAARARVVGRFSLDTRVREHLRLYAELTARRAAVRD